MRLHKTVGAIRMHALIGAVFVVACGEPAQEPANTSTAQASMTSAPSVTATEIEDLGVRNGTILADNLLAAGQVTELQFEELVDMGYTNFISLRPTSENGAGWEETHVVDDDVMFTRIPVAGAGGLTRENVMALNEILEEAEASSENTVLYCASSNRVGGLLALKAYWLDGIAPDDALEIGRQAGLTGLESAVQELLSQPR